MCRANRAQISDFRCVAGENRVARQTVVWHSHKPIGFPYLWFSRAAFARRDAQQIGAVLAAARMSSMPSCPHGLPVGPRRCRGQVAAATNAFQAASQNVLRRIQNGTVLCICSGRKQIREKVTLLMRNKMRRNGRNRQLPGLTMAPDDGLAWRSLCDLFV